MTKINVKIAILMVLFTGMINSGFSQDFLMNSLKDELNYQTDKYKDNADKPYFLQFNVKEVTSNNMRFSFGSIISNDLKRVRFFVPEVRIGDYKLDNTHVDESNPYGKLLSLWSQPQILTIEDSIYQISKTIRKSVDNAYENALETFKQNKKVYTEKVTKADRDDFTKENPNVFYEAPATINFNKSEWENNLKEFTGIFAGADYIERAEGEFEYTCMRSYIINTEGSMVVQNSFYAQITIALLIKCSDDNVVPLIKTFFAFTPEGLPNKDELKKVGNELKEMALQLKDAPTAESYSGPCILSATTSGVFFHEIFGHRIEGHRMNSKIDAQTLKNKIGDEILPDFINISFDPTIRNYEGRDLYGYYKFDDQAVNAQKVEIVKNGKLLKFLMCRTPIDSIHTSNGHGRSLTGANAVSRQSNMFVESSKSSTDSELKEQLIKLCKKQKLKYGYYFKEVIGGFTSTSSTQPNVISIIPIIVYKVYVDGRPDELVKGVSLIGTPLNMFSEIIQVGNEKAVFNGLCGAESGDIPVSTISPAILVSKIETQKMLEMKNETKQIVRPDLIK